MPLAVTAEVEAGCNVFQEIFTLQLLPPEAMRQEEETGVRVPDIEALVAQVLPFHLVPPAQEAFMFAEAKRVGVPLML